MMIFVTSQTVKWRQYRSPNMSIMSITVSHCLSRIDILVSFFCDVSGTVLIAPLIDPLWNGRTRVHYGMEEPGSLFGKVNKKRLNLGVLLVLPFHRRKVVNPFHKPVFSLELLGTKAPDPFHKCYFFYRFYLVRNGYHHIKLGRGHKQAFKFDEN